MPFKLDQHDALRAHITVIDDVVRRLKKDPHKLNAVELRQLGECAARSGGHAELRR